jgi:nicotinamidase-related amidase
MMKINPLPRSPQLMSRHDTALLVVDVQQKLLAHIAGHRRVAWNTRRLIDGAHILGMQVLATEQYPQGLGPTLPELAERLGDIPSKLRFSCGGCAKVFEGLPERGIHKLLVVGIEAHVCVQQTVFDLMTHGFAVFVGADAVGSRYALDYELALRRMESAGATLTSTEAALFEWCEEAGTPEFKRVSALVKEKPPEQ